MSETVNSRLNRALADGGWRRLSRTDGTWYRWVHNEHGEQCREELHIIYQGRRIACWSVWHNVRVASPDQEAGRTERLLIFARGEDASARSGWGWRTGDRLTSSRWPEGDWAEVLAAYDDMLWLLRHGSDNSCGIYNADDGWNRWAALRTQAPAMTTSTSVEVGRPPATTGDQFCGLAGIISQGHPPATTPVVD